MRDVGCVVLGFEDSRVRLRVTFFCIDGFAIQRSLASMLMLLVLCAVHMEILTSRCLDLGGVELGDRGGLYGTVGSM